ncbi:MAG: Na+/H+ antiporter NhaC family protein [candidate division KSB1 bacterium]|nr:Na+/H+ antiporter NhaC family protein [candidate division KSB1 bacterium]
MMQIQFSLPLRTFLLFSLLTLSTTEGHSGLDAFQIEVPSLLLSGVPFTIRLTALKADGSTDTSYHGCPTIDGLLKQQDGKLEELKKTSNFENGELALTGVVVKKWGASVVTVSDGTVCASKTIQVIPGILSLLPPILAIVLALTVRQVLLALFCGAWLGSIFISHFNPVTGFMRLLDTYLISSLTEGSHVAIVLFSMTLGGMVGVISRSGGTQGIVNKISRYANHPRGGQIVAWALGIFIFFDDYANTLIVGNTMRPFTDRLHISREKLSYIVDSTAAPVASIAIISTWVGFQMGLIDSAFKSLGIHRDAYITFIQSIPYASYSILTCLFVLLIGITLRDFGPMSKAELRAITTGKVLRDGAQPLTDSEALDISAVPGTPQRWFNAVIPISVVIIVTLGGLYFSGLRALGPKASEAPLGQIIGAANSFNVLMWASFSGALMAILLAVTQRILSLSKALDAWVAGARAMILAMMILILAWSIGRVCQDLKTADYVINLTQKVLSPHLLPVLTFVVAAFISFSTGTSWATMAILVPIVIPIAHRLCLDAAIEPALAHSILLGTIGAVLSGSVFGDHCSPISDTTIMSSMASAADHIDHVNTQLPYAVFVALVACLVGYLPAGFGINAFISIAMGIVILTGGLFLVGKRSNVA